MTKIIDEVLALLPEKAKINEMLFEGANIVLYTKNKNFLLDNEGAIKQIVESIKKRVELRADQSLLMPEEKARDTITKILSSEIGTLNIIFDPQRSRVIIEAEKPGLAIGRGGELLKEIKKATLWTPTVYRLPPIRSTLLENIRQVLYENSDYRRKFLNKVGKRIYEGWTRERREEWVRITVLGAGREVGRSCFLLQTPESRVLLDCGLNVAAPPESMFPYLNVPEFNIQELDAVIISHAHLDHVGVLPYLFKMGYRGPVYCSAPTRDIGALLALDYISLAQKEGEEGIYTSTDVKEFVKHTICLNYGEVNDITPDIRLTLYDAGHNLGSSIVHLHIGNGVHNFVYSLDGSTPITLIDREGNTQFIPIGDVVDTLFKEDKGIVVDNGFVQERLNQKGYATIAFNPKTLKTEVVPITSFVRHPINEDVYNITTESGRTLRVTKSHSVFTARDGKIIPQAVATIKKGDFILGTKKINPPHRGEPIIDLLNYLDILRIKIEDPERMKQVIARHEPSFTKLFANDRVIAKKILRDHYSGLFKYEIAQKHKIHQRRVDRILSLLNVKNHPRVNHIFPDKLRITSDLARFIGYYLSEGNPNKNSQTINIANTNHTLLEDCSDIIYNAFRIEGDIRYKDDTVLFNSKQLKTLLTLILSCGKNAYEKRVPKELLFTNPEITSELLYGLFSGDGGIRSRKKGREINYGSKSQGLIQDITFLLLQHDIVPTIDYNKSNEMHNLHIYNAEKILAFLTTIDFRNEQRDTLFQEVTTMQHRKASFDMRIPLAALSLQTQASMAVSPWQNAATCGVTRLEQESLQEQDYKLLNADLLFDKIKSIEKVQPTSKYVYDLRIDGYENFISGNGFLFCHNTGDFNFENTNLLQAANTHYPRVESVMMESTYGSRNDVPATRRECEEFLTTIIKDVAANEGKVLMPVLGVGRSQEIMLILERTMREGRIPEMPIYVQGMLWDVTAIHTAYPDFYNPRVKQDIFQRDKNPFLSPIFKRVSGGKEMQEVIDGKGPYIIMATSGMLTGGASLIYFKNLAENPKNSIVLTCYQGVGSLGRRLVTGERSFNFTEGGSKKQDTINVKMAVHHIHGFSGHSNFQQLNAWLHKLSPRPKKAIVIHGEYSKTLEFASTIYQQHRIESVAPKNLETIRLR